MFHLSGGCLLALWGAGAALRRRRPNQVPMVAVAHYKQEEVVRTDPFGRKLKASSSALRTSSSCMMEE